MNRLFIILLFLFTFLSSLAQIKWGVTATGKHAEYHQAFKSGKKLFTHHQQKEYRDSLRQLRKIEKLNLKQLDSLRKVERKALRLKRRYNKALAKGDTTKAEKLKNKGIEFWEMDPILNSQDIENLTKLAGWTLPEEFGELLTIHGQYRRLRQDSTKPADQRLEALFNPMLKKMLGEQFNFSELDKADPFESLLSNKRKMESMAQKPKGLQESLNPKNTQERIRDAQKVFIEKGSQLDQVQKDFAKLKRKYMYVPNSSDLSTAVKRSSLQNKKFHQRFVLGGNIQVASTDPIIGDIRPSLAYLVNKYFAVGLGVSWRQTFSGDSVSLAKETRAFNFNVSHDVWKGYFATAQFERNFKKVPQLNTDPSYKWVGVNAAYFGVGKRIQISRRIYTTIVLLYNVLHDRDAGLYQRPISFRFGFEWKGS